jgi:hypothetical protein
MNRIRNTSVAIIGLLLVIHACAPPKNIGTQKVEMYEENLSEWRAAYIDSLETAMEQDPAEGGTAPGPETPVLTATINTANAIDADLEEFLDIVTERKSEDNLYQGYTVQVYTGSSRQKANEAKNKVYAALPEARPTITFDAPNYKVKVGEFSSRLDAQAVFSALKGSFATVLIVPERFPVVRN